MIYFNYVLSRYDLLQLCALSLYLWPTSIVLSLSMTYCNCVISLTCFNCVLSPWPTSIMCSLSMTYCNCVISMTYFNCMWSIWPTSTVCDLYDLLQLHCFEWPTTYSLLKMTYFNFLFSIWFSISFLNYFNLWSLMLLVTVLLCRPMTFWRTFKWLTKTNLFIQMYEDSYVN